MCPLVTEAMEVTPASSHLVPSPIPTAALLQRQSFGWYMSDRKELLGPRGVTQDRALLDCLRFTSRGQRTVNKPNTCLWIAGRGFRLIYFFRPYFKNQKLKKVLFFYLVHHHRCFCAAANEQMWSVLCQTLELTNLPKSSLLKKLRSLLI